MIFWENERSERHINIIGKVVSNMEIEAYKMQYSYDKSFPGTVSSLKDIDVHSVGGIMNGEHPVYEAIHQYSIFLKERNKLINQ